MLTPIDIKNGWVEWDAIAAAKRPDPYVLPDNLNPEDRVQLHLSDGTKRLFSVAADRARWARTLRPGPHVVAYRRCPEHEEDGDFIG